MNKSKWNYINCTKDNILCTVQSESVGVFKKTYR